MRLLRRLLEAAACEALLTALLGRLLETGASVALLAARVRCDRVCICLRLWLCVLRQLLHRWGVLIIGLSSSNWLLASSSLRRPALAWSAGSLGEFQSTWAAPATCPCVGRGVSGGLRPYLTAPATCPCFGRGVSGGVSVLLACPSDLPFCVGRVVWRGLALTLRWAESSPLCAGL